MKKKTKFIIVLINIFNEIVHEINLWGQIFYSQSKINVCTHTITISARICTLGLIGE